ncbi:hypothetical protein BZZ01_05105 [Nostocales cyanobacterium HT-58-2]|nr:hypothetical protein BZZ01_05105 [Nostocales cyanobacterium HT-58-2]
MSRLKSPSERKIAKGRRKILVNFETTVSRAERINQATWALNLSKREFLEQAIDSFCELHKEKIEVIAALAAAK